jgi:hypothetical protein
VRTAPLSMVGLDGRYLELRCDELRADDRTLVREPAALRLGAPGWSIEAPVRLLHVERVWDCWGPALWLLGRLAGAPWAWLA